MPNSPTIPTFESISLDNLTRVSGGTAQYAEQPMQQAEDTQDGPRKKSPVEISVSVTGYGAPVSTSA